jgi:hypothetical protein
MMLVSMMTAHVLLEQQNIWGQDNARKMHLVMEGAGIFACVHV